MRTWTLVQPVPECSESPIARTTRRTAALAVSLVLLVAACGGDDDGDAAGPADDSPTTGADAGAAGDTEDGAGTTADDEGEEGSTADRPAVPSAGCEGDAPAGEVEKERHELGGMPDPEGEPRFYLLTAPEAADPVPLVVDFHGLAEGAEVHSGMSELGELGLEEGFAAAFPHGTGSPVAWQVFEEGVASPELPYVDAVLDDLFAARCIDTARVYATGLSNGAMMTSMLACTRADRFAAFAPVAGISTWEGCDPSRPVPMLGFHGTADPILYFNGGVGDLSVVTGDEAPEDPEIPEADLDGEGYPETARTWAEANGCEPGATDEEVTDEVVERTWSCPEGAPVRFVIVVGGGHSWPGSEFSEAIGDIVGPTTFDISASEEMWGFFQQHALPES